MYISMPRDFFVPVMYEYKKDLDLLDENNVEMTRESNESRNFDKVYNEEEFNDDITYITQNIYVSANDENVNSNYDKQDKYDNDGCSKGETKENHNVSINTNIYSDIDDEYARGFSR